MIFIGEYNALLHHLMNTIQFCFVFFIWREVLSLTAIRVISLAFPFVYVYKIVFNTCFNSIGQGKCDPCLIRILVAYLQREQQGIKKLPVDTTEIKSSHPVRVQLAFPLSSLAGIDNCFLPTTQQNQIELSDHREKVTLNLRIKLKEGNLQKR